MELSKKKLNIVVFGGSGFLGSHVSDKLSESGHQVVIFDIKESPWLRTNQKIIIEDLLNTDAVNRAVKGANVVYNFAGISDLNHAYEEPFKTMEINVLGQTKLLEACRKYDVERFIYASTVYVNSKEGSF